MVFHDRVHSSRPRGVTASTLGPFCRADARTVVLVRVVERSSLVRFMVSHEILYYNWVLKGPSFS